jgi:hypothetical protein
VINVCEIISKKNREKNKEIPRENFNCCVHETASGVCFPKKPNDYNNFRKSLDNN